MGDTPAPDQDEDCSELQLLSFVVRLWIEEPATTQHAARWRGRITHVQSGSTLYVEQIADMAIFVTEYLQAVGARVSPLWRTARWLRRRW